MATVTAELDRHGYRVDLRSGRHRLVADEPAAAGGGAAGPSPVALMLAGLAACTAITLRMYAERKGWPLTGLRVRVVYEVDGGAGRIRRDLRVSGDLDERQRARLADIAERTPVTRLVKGGVAVETGLE